MPWNENLNRTAEYDQSKAWGSLLGRLSSDVGARHGVCQELSAKWVRMVTKARLMSESPYSKTKKNRYKTSAGRMLALNQASTMRKAIIRHERGSNPLGGKGALTDVVNKPYGTGKVFALPQDNVNDAYGINGTLMGGIMGASFADVVKNISSAKKTCFILVFTCPAGGHAVACYTSSSLVKSARNVVFFDPNYGEYKLKANKFGRWFADYLAQRLYLRTIFKAKAAKIKLYKCDATIIAKDARNTEHLNMFERMPLMKMLMAEEED